MSATRNGGAGRAAHFSTPVMTTPADEHALEDEEQDDRDDHRHQRARLDEAGSREWMPLKRCEARRRAAAARAWSRGRSAGRRSRSTSRRGGRSRPRRSPARPAAGSPRPASGTGRRRRSRRPRPSRAGSSGSTGGSGTRRRRWRRTSAPAAAATSRPSRSSTKMVYVGMSVTAPGRKIVAISSVNRSVAAREPEPREAVGHERARERRPDHPDERDRDGVEQQPREVEQVPDVGEVLPVRATTSRPRSSARHEPCQVIGRRPGSRGRRTGSACRPGLTSASVRGAAVDRHLVDVVVVALVGERLRASTGRSGAFGLGQLVGLLSETMTERSSGDRNAARTTTAMNVSANERVASRGRRGRPPPEPRHARGRVGPPRPERRLGASWLSARPRSRPSAARSGTGPA